MRTDWARWAIVVAGVSVFCVLILQFRTPGSAISQWDHALASAAQQDADQHPAILETARTVTDAGGVPAMTCCAILGALLLGMCGHPRLARLWLVAAAIGGVLNFTSKEVLDRQRPDATLRDQAVHERNPSFPSGHAMGSTIGYGTLAYVGFVLLQRKRARWTLAAALACLVATICWSRVYLRAHWFSDVVAGVAIGSAWLAACINLLGRPRGPDPLTSQKAA